jgi:hypothetical protein
MHTDNGRVDHLYSRVMGACQFVHNLAPDARPPPANEAIVAGGAKPNMNRQARLAGSVENDPKLL